MCSARLVAVSTLLGLVFFAGPARAHPLLIERIAARVDGRPIFLSTLRERARPFVYRLRARGVPRWGRASAVRTIYKQVLQRVIDDRLIARAARAEDIVVTKSEVDRALAVIARQNGLGLDELYARWLVEGCSAAEVRAGVRRGLIENRLLQLWIAQHRDELSRLDSKARERFVQKERARWLARLRRRAIIEVRLVP